MDDKVGDFLYHTFSLIESLHPSVTIEYKYSDLTKSHIVKITPSDTFHSEKFSVLRGVIYKSWLKIDTEDDFGIVSSDTIIKTSDMEVIYCPPVIADFPFDNDDEIYWEVETDYVETTITIGMADRPIKDKDNFEWDTKYGMAA